LRGFRKPIDRRVKDVERSSNTCDNAFDVASWSGRSIQQVDSVTSSRTLFRRCAL
jgi:hypothetical protein